ncbi:unnamed protein product [Urochloa humidicola]
MNNVESRGIDYLESILEDPSAEPCNLHLEYLRDITNDFSIERELGRGGFGVVYKGVLPNGEIVAVKNLVSMSEVQEKQFINEVDNLMGVRHQNIVRFVGYCYESWHEYIEYNGARVFAEKPKRLLCFEYMPNGSLDRYITDESCGLDWNKRYKIIMGICCGLHYLHKQCQINASVLHLDLKPANILLDENMVPKIADFGLSKLFDDAKFETCATTLAGSYGYMAPEYVCNRIITTKADIYSLGVIIIEMVTGRRIGPFDVLTSWQDFVEPVLNNWRNRLEEAMRYTTLEIYCQQIKSILEIGLSCVKINRMERPTTTEIIQRLNRLQNKNCYASDEEKPHADKDSNTNNFRQYSQDPSHQHADSIDIIATAPSNFVEENAGTREVRLDGDLLPGIEGFQIVGEPKQGSVLTACGFPTNGTTLCNFQWVRHLENGTRQEIEGATMYDYFITADDVGTLLAVDCVPMDDTGLQGDLVTEFANNGNKITCDPNPLVADQEMQNEIDLCTLTGRAYFDVFVKNSESSEDWELARLMLRRTSYQIKLKCTGKVLISEKYLPSLQIEISLECSTRFVLVSSAGARLRFSTENITQPNNQANDFRLRNLIVLVMRAFQNKWSSGGSPDSISDTEDVMFPNALEEPGTSTSEGGEQDDSLPGIRGLRMTGEAFPGRDLCTSGYPTNGTETCNFEWVRHLEDGSVNYIEGARRPSYRVTADDVDAVLAVEIQPLDASKRKGDILKIYANEKRKITYRETKEVIERSLKIGNKTFDVQLLQVRFLNMWVPAVLEIERECYSIKCNKQHDIITTEKFQQATSIDIPYGYPTEFSITSAEGAKYNLMPADNALLRDTIVLVLRAFRLLAVERKQQSEEISSSEISEQKNPEILALK